MREDLSLNYRRWLDADQPGADLDADRAGDDRAGLIEDEADGTVCEIIGQA